MFCFTFFLQREGKKALSFCLTEFFSLLESSGYASLFPFKPKEATVQICMLAELLGGIFCLETRSCSYR